MLGMRAMPAFYNKAFDFSRRLFTCYSWRLQSTSLFTVHALLNIAVRAARRAGEVIVRNLNRLESLTVTSKSRNDFVSEVDTQAEAEIIGIIRKLYPNHAFLAEESGQSGD